MLSSAVLAAVALKPLAVIAVVVVALVMAGTRAMRLRRRMAAQPEQRDPGDQAADGSSPAASPGTMDVQDRWRRLAGNVDLDLHEEPPGGPLQAISSATFAPDARALAATDAPDLAPAREADAPQSEPAPAPPAAGMRHAAHLDATRFFSDPDVGLADTIPARHHSPDEHARGRRPDDAPGLSGVQAGVTAAVPPPTRFFSTHELVDDQAPVDHSMDGPTGGLLALPPGTDRPAQGDAGASVGGADDGLGGTGPLAALPPASPAPASRVLDRVRERLNAAATSHVVALSVIDSTGRVLAGTADQDVAGELQALMAESGLGDSADLVQPMRFADNSRGAMLLLPTGANALLGALVRDSDDLHVTRSHLRNLAREIGATMRAAS